MGLGVQPHDAILQMRLLRRRLARGEGLQQDGVVTTTQRPALYDPEAVATIEQLYATYRVLRDEQPVYASPDGKFVALSRYDDVHRALSSPDPYSSVFLKSAFHPILAQLDPPVHTAMRKVILHAFTPSRVARLEDEIRAIAVGLLDQLIPIGEFDLVVDYAGVLPSTVMGRLIGVPEDLIPMCREISDLHMRRITYRDALVPMQMSDELFGALLAERRRHAEDDLLTALLEAEVDGRCLTDDELLGFCYLLLIGGNDTTTNWIGNAAALLARHPDIRARLVNDQSCIPPAMEEAMRIESPTQLLTRRTTSDMVLHDTSVAAGTRVLLVLGAANRDEREFDEPDRFDIDRREARHLALGHGIHFCLGAVLARLEARIAFEELLARVPEYEIAGTPERLRSSWALGYEHLRVEW